MKAARVVARRKIEFLDVPEPGRLEESEVLIKLEALSVCGSDIYLEYDAELKERGWIDPGVLKSHDMKFEDAQEAFEMYRLRQDDVIKIAMSF